MNAKTAENRIKLLLREAAACLSDIEHKTINGFDKRSLARKGLEAIQQAEKLLPTITSNLHDTRNTDAFLGTRRDSPRNGRI